MWFLLVTLLLAAAPAFAEFDHTFRETYPLPADGTFTLTNVNGSVRVEGWERDAVEIEAVKIARGSPTDLYRVHIEVQASEQAVHVVTRYPQGEGVEVLVEYQVRVPFHAVLGQVSTVNGEVTVRGMESRGEVRTINGHLKLLDSSGRFDLRTTNGNVHVELARGVRAGSLNIETVNGAVFLALPPGSGAELDLSTTNGELLSDLPVTLQGSGSRDFRGRIGHGGGTIRVRTMNGSIQLANSRPTV
jgi:hypothetical protein